MNTNRKLGLLLILMAALILLGGSIAAAQEVDSDPVAVMSVGPRQIDWQPQVTYERLVLTISQPDRTVLQETFVPGNNPFFSVVDPTGNRRVDGQYTFELRVVPLLDEAARAALSAARESGDSAAVIEGLRSSGALPQQPLVQSGTFLIQDGRIILGDATQAEESPGPSETILDQVIADDLIVQGSACIGLDCVNGESFGFDTLRLKENNLRIRFDDTSSSASFPNNDWQLIANESSNGGLNKFSIEDATAGRTPFTIEAGAPTHSLYVDDIGRVGLGTSAPAFELHIADGDTPAVRLEQDGTSGFTPQTWDMAGNEANFFIRDATNGSRLPFRIRPGAPTDSLHILASGDVGIGTASPMEKLHVNGNFLVDGDGQVNGNVQVEGYVTEFSDVNAKENFGLVDGQEVLARLASLPITTWNYKSQDPGIRHMGPMAQDFHAAFGLGQDDLHIASLDTNGVALAAIQGLNQAVQENEAQITALRQQNQDLEDRLMALERAIGAGQNGVTSFSAGPQIMWLLGAGLFVVGLMLGKRWPSGGGR